MKKKDQPLAESSFASGGSSSPRLTAEDIQAKEFRIARLRGYKERDVDEFLDDLTLAWGALLDENQRLRSHTGGVSSIGAPDLDEVARQADEIITRARQAAGRIVAEAEVTAGVRPPGDDDRAAVASFLSKERTFLQDLASLVQGHAEGVKGMAREVFAKPASAEPVTPARSVAPPVAEPATPDAPPPAVSADEKPRAEPSSTEPATTEAVAAEEDEEPIRIEEPETASVRVPEHDEESGDRSLKELFWGEE
jgi:DivIVA domain-containing protein